MLPLKLRIKILNKIAQAMPSLPSTTVNTTTIPAPPAFNPISGPWTFITKAYNAPTVQYLSYLLGILNTAMHYASNGQFNLQKNQNNLSQIDSSGLFSVDAKNIILLAKLFYNTFLNNGKPFEQLPTPVQIAGWAETISHSQPLANLSQINQTGQLAQQLNFNYKLDGSLRQNIINYLGYIVTYNPRR